MKKSKLYMRILMYAITGFLFATVCDATIITNSPVLDITIYDITADGILNGDGKDGSTRTTMDIGFRDYTKGLTVERGVLYFDLNALPEDVTINSAKLFLQWGGGVGTQADDADLVHLSDINRTSSSSADYEASATMVHASLVTPTDVNGISNVVVTSFIQTDIANDTYGARYAVFRLQTDSIDPATNGVNNYYQFISDNNASVSARPKLIIDYTAVIPVPATIVLLTLSGLGVLLLRRIQRK